MYTTNQISLFQVSEISIVYRPAFKSMERPKILGAKTAYDILFQHWDLDQIELREEFKILLLNRGSRVLGISSISAGSVAGTVVDPKLVFSTALKANASSIILAHNHPSGNLKPSNADLELTAKLANGGKILDIAILDHIIVTREGFYSFSDVGRL